MASCAFESSLAKYPVSSNSIASPKSPIRFSLLAAYEITFQLLANLGNFYCLMNTHDHTLHGSVNQSMRQTVGQSAICMSMYYQ